MWTPNALLRPVRTLQAEIDQTVLKALEILRSHVGNESELFHIGSTSHPELHCRGIVDILLRGTSHSQHSVRSHLERDRELRELPLPVDVHFEQREAESPLLRTQSILATNALQLGAYLALQKRFAHVPGSKYPAAKRTFFESLSTGDVEEIREPHRVMLETERLQLVSPLSCDGTAYANYRKTNGAHVAVHASSDAERLEPEFWAQAFAYDHRERMLRESLTLLVKGGEDSTLLGSIHFSGFVWGPYRHCFAGYNLAKSAQGHGYMTEAMTAALHYLHAAWSVHRVQAIAHPENARSEKLLERLGFSVVGTLPQHRYEDEQWHDCLLFGKTLSL